MPTPSKEPEMSNELRFWLIYLDAKESINFLENPDSIDTFDALRQEFEERKLLHELNKTEDDPTKDQ